MLFNLFGKNKTVAYQTPGEERTWENQGHRIVYSVVGEGTPLLLIHGINAAASSIEFRSNISELAKHYKVYIPDLPGYGRSERKRMRYTADLNISFIGDFARFIHEIEQQTPNVIASSLSSAHLISAVNKNPENFGAITLVCPTGLGRLDFKPNEKLHKLFMGWFGSVVFWLLTTKLSTKIFLGRDGYKDPKILTKELVEMYYQTSHQPNAKYAPIAFVSGFFNHSVKGEWEKIEQPVLIVWGKDANLTPVEDAQKFLQLRPQTGLKIIDNARLLPQDEQSAEFNRIVLEWFAEKPSLVAV